MKMTSWVEWNVFAGRIWPRGRILDTLI